MTEKIAWVTDSTGFLDEELQHDENVFIIPINIHIEGKSYQDGVDLTNDEMFAAMQERAAVAKTSQPSIGQFQQLYQRLEHMGYDRVLSFLVSEQLSGTVSSSIQASKLVNIPVHTFDSRLLSYPMTFIMKKAMKLHKNGKKLKEIISSAITFRDSNETYVLIGSLEQLHRSGRLHSIKYYLGSFLKIKPIISVVKGKLEIPEIARNEAYAEKIIFSKLREAVDTYGITECMILHGQFRNQSDKWVKKIEQLYPHMQLHVYPLGTAIGVHAGGNTLGISWFKEKM